MPEEKTIFDKPDDTAPKRRDLIMCPRCKSPFVVFDRILAFEVKTNAKCLDCEHTWHEAAYK